MERPARMPFQPGFDLRMFVGGVVVDDGFDQLAGRHRLRKRMNSSCRCCCMQRPITRPSSTLSAANRVKRASTHRLSDILPNDGLHFHVLLAIPQVSRLRKGLVRHIHQNEMRYRGNQGKITKIDVRPVQDLDGRLMDYTFKHIKRRSFSLDDILVLPRSHSELEPKGRRGVKGYAVS